ncbi:tetratricopeptide repeat protein [Mucilaginibacter conchicola]|uniref:Tetratricopeptide repeat protein n=1 Tax=Mucilaginibacter conchicola TaxID=2303333 RepID=A0A372NT11_9SPHI|nr:tetratricopeptide repeat protein [Mucilaginibacter conchicola]RFZ92262.1 tetratricopeptide repeat protein [Mucilaginibacter conchicola]
MKLQPKLTINLCLLLFLITSTIAVYGQRKKKDANYYFNEALIREKVSPGNPYVDSIFRSCIKLYSKAIKLNPRFCGAYANRAWLYSELKDYKNELYDLTQAIRYCAPAEKLMLRELRAGTYYRLGQYKNSIRDYNQTIPFDKNQANLYSGRAMCYWKLGEKDKACIDYKKALGLDPKVAEDKEFLDCN